MKTALLTLACISLQATCLAQAFDADDGGFVLKRNAEFIRFEKGRWTAGIEGVRAVSWHAFLWHDQWLYETLPGGAVEAEPTLNDDGTITMSGTFSVTHESAPLRYALRITPSEEGVRVRCELEKTGPLKLTNGVYWLSLFADRKAFTGKERVWLRPSWHGAISSTARGTAKRLFVELQDGRSVCIGGERHFPVRTYGSKTGYVWQLNLLPGDFGLDEKAVVEYTISFDDMPDSFPGEVKPMKEQLAIREVTTDATQVARYDRVELSVNLGATYDNPYDPDDVALDAVFTAPSGKQLSVPGFFTVRQRREIRDGNELMIPEGNGEWRVRFAPMEVGEYTWRLTLRDRTGEVSGGEGTFEAVAGEGKGFVRQSEADPHYLAFDNGEGYFAIGHNLPIYHTSGQLGDEAMRRFAAASENFNRWWMCSYGFGIEWEDRLGWYRQNSAAQIDLCLDVARGVGLYYMMCMDTHQDFRTTRWETNPFNAKNGGPCETPADWFTNETARELYRKRLRYTVARWGYSPNVLCWEFGNEFEGWADSPNEIKLPWHEEMSEYLAAIDPFGHMITTSFWGKTGPEEFWSLPNIDIVQTHCYTNNDENVAGQIRGYSLRQWERFTKPHIFGEFGIRSHSSTADKDPEGWGIHNALWSGLFSFCAGPPMPWWHENYIDKLDLYFHFTALANFAQDLPLGTARWEPLEVEGPEYQDPNREPILRDVKVIARSRWGKPEHDEFVVLGDGAIEGELRPQDLLQGQGHKDIKHPPTFIVNYPQDGRFIVSVGNVSNSGLLRIWVDGDQKLEVELPCGEGLEKKSVWQERWNLWETTYDRDIALDIPAGQHRIRIENFGKDWVRVKGYTFTGCKVLDKPNLLACGMKTEGLGILWLQNRDSSWYNHAGNGEVGQVDAFEVTVQGLPDGSYQLEWWETWKGAAERTEEVEVRDVRDGGLKLSLPPLRTDIALRMRRVR